MPYKIIQQQVSVQAAAGGGAAVVPYNFVAPSAGYWYAEHLADPSGSQVSATGDPRTVQESFSADLANNVGTILTNVPGGYALWGCMSFHCTSGGGVSFDIREGAGASTLTSVNSSTVPARVVETRNEAAANITPEGQDSFIFTTSGPNSGRDAEWGLWFGNDTTNSAQVYHGTLVIMPMQNAGGTLNFNGSSHLGKRNSEWFAVSASPNSISCDAQVGGNEDQTVSSAVMTFDHSDLYLLMPRCDTNQSTTATAMRYTYYLDGQDIFNVRSGNTTSGATRAGRGFQFRNGAAGDGNQPRVHVTGVRQINAGDHVFSFTGNRHESADTGDTFETITFWAFRASMFSKFAYSQHTSAIVVSSDANTTAPWSITINCDGVTPVVIGFTTSVHVYQGYVDLVLLQDGVAVSRDVAANVIGGFSTSPWVDMADGTNGTGDTDNVTLPCSFLYTATPAAGNHTYQIRYRRNSASASAGTGGGGSASSIINCRDDGSSGFIGTLWGFEMKFATVY